MKASDTFFILILLYRTMECFVITCLICTPAGQMENLTLQLRCPAPGTCPGTTKEKQMKILAYFRVMYTVGYCVSLVSLSLALIILLLFRNSSVICCSLDYCTSPVRKHKVNFFIFIRIIHILVTKLKAHQMRYSDYKFRLAKSTLTLIPLLGIHEVIFAVLTEEHTEGILRNVNLFFQLFFNSFQVQAEIKKKWQRWKLGMTDLDDLRNTGSNTPQVGASVPLFSHPSPCLPTAHFLNDSRLSAPPHLSPPPPSPPPLPQLPIPHSYNHHQDQLGARQLKTYCYIPVHKQDGGEDDVNSCESCC
ncbi:hypothetical protein PAMP_018235 [Pampus punctatissimus]